MCVYLLKLLNFCLNKQNCDFLFEFQWLWLETILARSATFMFVEIKNSSLCHFEVKRNVLNKSLSIQKK